MYSLLVLASVVAIAAGQSMTSIQETAPATITSATASTARPASAVTTSYARYTPIKTIDSWECATKNISDYLLPPMPTGGLLEVYYDHSGVIYSECEEHIPKPFTSYPACPSVAKASWCAYVQIPVLPYWLSTAVPSSNMAEFRAYTSIASSWWAARSSALPDILDECPNTWEDLKWDIPGGEIWLNATIALADCENAEKLDVDANAQPASGSQVVAGSQSPAASPSSPAKESASGTKKIDIFSAWLAVSAMFLF